MAKKQSEEHSEEITNQIREVRFGYKLGQGPREGRVVHWPISIYANGKMSEFLRSRSASSHLAEICQQRILRTGHGAEGRVGQWGRDTCDACSMAMGGCRAGRVM